MSRPIWLLIAAALAASSARGDTVTPGPITSLSPAIAGLTGLRPEIAQSPLGRAIVAWEEASAFGTVVVRYAFLDEQGALAAGPFTVVPLAPIGTVRWPRVAASRYGFALTWEETDIVVGGPTVQRDVRIRLFDYVGGVIADSIANSLAIAALYDEARPTCGASLDGTFYAAWVRRTLVPGLPTEGVWFRRYDALGNTLDPIEVRADFPGGNFGMQDHPAICGWPSGRFLVVWVDGPFGAPATVPSPDGGGSALVARWFQPGLVPLVQNVLPAGNLPRDQWGPRLAADERTSCVLGFTGDTSDTEIDAYLVRLTDQGQIYDPTPLLLTPGNPTDQILHAVAMTTSGESAASWYDAVQTTGQPAPRTGFIRRATTGAIVETGLLDASASPLESQGPASLGTDQFGNLRAVWTYETPAGRGLRTRALRRNMIVPLNAPQVGAQVPFLLSSPSNPGQVYQLLVSFGTGPFFVDTRILRLTADPLLVAALLAPSAPPFVGFAGTLDGTGLSTAPILTIPPFPALAGTAIHLAFVTIDPFNLAPSSIDTISDTLSLTIL